MAFLIPSLFVRFGVNLPLTGLVSFGIRGEKYVVGNITEAEVLDQEKPFQELVSGAGWLVRGGMNHVEASASEGHLDVLREGDEGEDEGKGLEDVMAAKLARTAIGHDAEGRLILLQVCRCVCVSFIG